MSIILTEKSADPVANYLLSGEKAIQRTLSIELFNNY